MDETTPIDPVDECDALLHDLLHVAEKQLREGGKFAAFAGYVKPDGAFVHVGAEEDALVADNEVRMRRLEHHLRELAHEGGLRAGALFADVVVPDPRGESDAIAIWIDHREGHRAHVLIRYRLPDEGQERIHFEKPEKLPCPAFLFEA